MLHKANYRFLPKPTSIYAHIQTRYGQIIIKEKKNGE